MFWQAVRRGDHRVPVAELRRFMRANAIPEPAELQQDMPRCILIADGEPNMARALGADGVLAKPFTNEEMLAAVCRLYRDEGGTMNKLIKWQAALMLLLSALVMSNGVRAQSSAQLPASRLLLTGSTTMAPLMVEIGRRFQTLHPRIQIEVQMGGSGRGISDARQGKADIGMVSRALGERERDLTGMPIARDGVAIIVHKDNPVSALSDRQLLDIYSGKIANWRQVGGRDAPLHMLAGPPEGASSELFSHYLQLPYEQIKAQGRVAANAERIAAVAADPRAIIWVSVGEAERKALDGVPIKLLAVGGVAAGSKTVRNGNYPISRPLTLVTRGTPTGATRAFIEFCVSSQVTDLVLAFDFVPYLD
ncbi:MAG: phosphate ABC transporter substrate-binding protein [Oxalobacteraceae bacterium]|nr:phosphate ABC transporter substrate-binding protein [Oxalobacteraceae bacterium]